MNKVLVIGDPHATVEELDDCERLIDLIISILETAKGDIQYVLFMGDQHHNHSVVRVEVIQFWRRAFKRINQYAQIFAIVGNHDRPGDASSTATAMQAYEDQVMVIDEPTKILVGVMAAPFYHDADKFIQDVRARSAGISTLFCHQTFLGCYYENGTPAKDVANPNELGVTNIISGHIHTPQEYSNVWYVGAPRWRTASDVNLERNIWVLEFADNGILQGRTPISTQGVCREMVHYVDRENKKLEGPEFIHMPATMTVDVYGSEAYVVAKATEWQGKGYKPRTFVQVEHKPSAIRESMGIDAALRKFMLEYQAKNSTPNEVLLKMLEERVNVGK